MRSQGQFPLWHCQIKLCKYSLRCYILTQTLVSWNLVTVFTLPICQNERQIKMIVTLKKRKTITFLCTYSIMLCKWYNFYFYVHTVLCLVYLFQIDRQSIIQYVLHRNIEHTVLCFANDIIFIYMYIRYYALSIYSR